MSVNIACPICSGHKVYSDNYTIIEWCDCVVRPWENTQPLSARLKVNNDGSITIVATNGLEVKIEPNKDGTKEIMVTEL